MAQENIVNGMDLDKLEAFRASLKQDPITLGLEVTGTCRIIVHALEWAIVGVAGTPRAGVQR